MDYTKGTWERRGQLIICRTPDGVEYIIAEMPFELMTESEANARLIAAAPALYKALKALSEWKLVNPDIGRPGLPVEFTGGQIALMVTDALSQAEGKEATK